jgi:hypothetical protein
LAADAEPEVVPEPEPVVEEVEIAPYRKHPWFASWGQLRGDR